jgi:hypothetical protein
LSLAAIFKTIVEVLQECGVPHMLTGSLAGAYYAAPRSTQDVDLVVDINVEQLRDLVQRCGARGPYVSEMAAEEALRTRGQFNVIDARTGWKVDLIIRKDQGEVVKTGLERDQNGVIRHHAHAVAREGSRANCQKLSRRPSWISQAS